MPPAYGLQIFLNNHCDPLPPRTAHPLLLIREIYWADPVDAATGPIHHIVEGPANVPEVVAQLQLIVQRWRTDAGERAPHWSLVVLTGPNGPMGTSRIGSRTSSSPPFPVRPLRTPSRHDPRHLLRCSSTAIAHPSKSLRKLEQLIHEHDPHFDPVQFGLRPILAEYGSLEIEQIPRRAA